MRAQKWFLSLSYYASFESIFTLMEQETLEEVRFLSHQTSQWWKDRWKMEMKEECKKGKHLRQVRVKGCPPSKNMMAEWKWMQDEMKLQNVRHELKHYEVEAVAQSSQVHVENTAPVEHRPSKANDHNASQCCALS
mmetsp:Transcript_993/g.1822  ORF Transcript_993/g.1822 Transcript_993/m.1822 type:complete len:136 (-) Transcript_993:42-449(-)